MVWAVSVSLAATQEIAFAFSSSGYLDVSVPQVCLLVSYVFRYGYHPITDDGFPHSDILGSKLTYSSPRRFVVRHVLLRLLVPRHSPCALSNLTKLLQITFASLRQLRVSRSCHVDNYAPFLEHLLSRSAWFSLQLHFGCRSSSHVFVSFVVLSHVTYGCTLHSFDHLLPRTARSSLPKTITYIRSF